MFSIKLTQEIPSGQVVYVIPFYEKEKDKVATFPLLLSLLALKPKEKIVEVVINEGEKIKRVIALRLEDEKKCTKRSLEELGALLINEVLKGTETIMVIDLKGFCSKTLDLLTGVLLNSWSFENYKTEGKLQREKIEILVLCDNLEEFDPYLKRLMAISEGVNYARTLTTSGTNKLYPIAYAEKLKELETLGVEVEILNQNQLQEIGMTAILAVGQGSSKESCVVILKWRGKNALKEPIVIVGKGVCFDSGGVCLKPPAGQIDMKWDNAGAGAVAGLIKSLALSHSKASVVGILGLVENMPDGHAMKPGDIIETLSKQTVEIINTDAEGRLVLADCLWYGQKRFNPQYLIDLGTLTLETIATLGPYYAGLYCDNFTLNEQLKHAGVVSGDLVWQLPMGEFFAAQLASEIADMTNQGTEMSGENGAAAEFLKKFVKMDKWAHLDIAGVSWKNENQTVLKKGVTGFGVRLLEEWIYKLSC